jgi:hypothetical protein
MSKKAIEAKIQLSRMEDILKEMEKQLHNAIEAQRPLNQKRYDLIKAGGKKAEVMKVNEELKKVAEEVQFYRDQIEITKQSIAEDKHELVKSLIKYRKERITEMGFDMNEIQKKLIQAKFDYLKKVHELYTVPFHEFNEELEELNQLIHNNGDGNRFKTNPRVLGAERLSPFVAPNNPYVTSPFITAKDTEKALLLVPIAFSLKLLTEYGITEIDEHKAELKYRDLQAKQNKINQKT